MHPAVSKSFVTVEKAFSRSPTLAAWDRMTLLINGAFLEREFLCSPLKVTNVTLNHSILLC